MAILNDDFLRLAGTWTGTTRLRWKPDSEPIDNPAEARVVAVAGGHGLAVESHAAHGEDPSVGMMLVSYDPDADRHAVAWVDSFHAAGGMVFTGAPVADALLAVHTTYAGDWGWTIRFLAEGSDTFVIRMDNVPPGQAPYTAVETRLTRI